MKLMEVRFVEVEERLRGESKRPIGKPRFVFGDDENVIVAKAIVDMRAGDHAAYEKLVETIDKDLLDVLVHPFLEEEAPKIADCFGATMATGMVFCTGAVTSISMFAPAWSLCTAG